MKIVKTLWLSFIMLLVGAMASVSAQNAVTVGSQVTDVNGIVSGKAYLLQHQGNGTNCPWIEDVGTYYNCPNSAGNCTLASVWYLINNGDDTWKIENAYTGKYWPKPTGNANLVGTDAANAGNWALNFSDGFAAPTCNGYNLNRNTPKLVGWNSGSGSVTQVKIYEVEAAHSTAALSEFTGNDIFRDTNPASSIQTGQWYVMSQRSRTTALFENASDHKLKHTLTMPTGSATAHANYLVRFIGTDDGKYYIQTGLGNYFGLVEHKKNVPTTALKTEKLTVAQIGDNAGHFYIQSVSNNVVLDANDFTLGDPSTVAGWETNVPSSVGGNNDWAIYPVFLAPEGQTPVKVVYQNTTETNYGAWDASKSAWTSKLTSDSYVAGLTLTKSAGEFNCFTKWNSHYNLAYKPSAANTDETLTLTAPAGYVIAGYSLLAAKAYSAAHTYTLKAEDGTTITPAYASSANGYTSLNITNVNKKSTSIIVNTTDASKYIAIADFVVYLKNEDVISNPLTESPSTEGWYAIKVQSTSNNSNAAANNFLYTLSSKYNNLYPLSHEAATTLKEDSKYYFYLTPHNGNVYWQMPNGLYLKNNSNKFPTTSAEPADIDMSYQSNYMRIKSGSYYADAYEGFVGETANKDRTKFDVYPLDLSKSNLTAWKVIINEGGAYMQVTCTRSDVNGLRAVYNNGYFFLPSDVTPTSADFSLEGVMNFAIDEANHTITANFDPSLAILTSGVAIEQGYQTAGLGEDVMLLRVSTDAFRDAKNASLTVILKDGTENNISKLTLYEASSSSPEILSAGKAGAPTKNKLDEVEVIGSTAIFNIGDFNTGSHYYWIAAAVKNNATLGAVLDAAVTSLSYQVAGQTAQDLDLTSVGDPADRGAMVFNVRSYPFLPWDEGSRVYRIPAMIVADDGSIIVAADKRYASHTDIGNGGHVIDIVIRRSTDGGKTWSDPVTIAKGLGLTQNGGNDNRCGYGDPSLVKGKDGKIYCLYAAGNLGYFYGQKGVCLSTSTDNGITWSSSTETSPTDLYLTGAIKNAVGEGAAGGYGLYDYFVTSGRGLYTSEGILMYLIPAQTLTEANYTTLKEGSFWNAASDDYIFYSTDDGATWYFSPTPMFKGGDEAKIIQIGEGQLLGSVRQSYNRGFCRITYTVNGDGTLTFTKEKQWNNNQLNAANNPNNQDIFYYQRAKETGKKDFIFHSMTTGQHANMKLYYSTDQGDNWTEFFNVQTKGTRYVTMEKSATGSLYLFFEDQSLNAAGGYYDYNHYPLNFIEITREQLIQKIPELEDNYEYNLALTPIGNASYATLYLPYGITLGSEAEAYKIAVEGEWAKPTSMGQSIPAETAMLIVSPEKASSVTVTGNTAASADTDGNVLAGTLTTQHVDGYVLNKDGDTPGFFKLSSGGTLAANRAYLPADVVSGNVKGVMLNWGDVDGINLIDNGQLIIDNAVIYNMAGQRVQKPQRGIYIVNGKKIVVK